MNTYEFGCDRFLIDSLKTSVEKSLLVTLYCKPYFKSVPIVDIYYRKINENAILVFLVILIVVPVILISISHISTKIIAPSIKALKDHFQFSLVFISFTIMASTSVSVVIGNLKDESTGEAYLKLSEILGTYIYSIAILITMAVFIVKNEIALPKVAVLKELTFSIIIVIFIFLIALRTTVNYLTGLLFVLIYGAYLVVSCHLENFFRMQNMTNEQEVTKKTDLEAINEEISNEEKEDSLSNSPSKSSNSDNKRPNNESQSKMRNSGELKIDFGEESQKDEDFFDKEDYVNKFTHKFNDCGLFSDITAFLNYSKYSKLDMIIKLPIDVVCLLIVPRNENPLMKTSFKYQVLGFSIAFSFFGFEILDFTILRLILLGLGFAISFYMLVYLGINAKIIDVTGKVLSIVVGLGALNIYLVLMTDIVHFVNFYYSIREILMQSIFLSINNSISQLFIYKALCGMGEARLVAISSFAVANFQLIFGLIVVIFRRTMHLLVDFDILILGEFEQRLNGKLGVPQERYFVRNMLLVVVLEVGLMFIYLKYNQFTLKPTFAFFGYSVYAIFILFALANSN